MIKPQTPQRKHVVSETSELPVSTTSPPGHPPESSQADPRGTMKMFENGLAGLLAQEQAEAAKLKDEFIMESDAWDAEFVKAIDLPKFIFRSVSKGQAVGEKSVVMVYLNTTPKTLKKGIYQKLAKAIKKNNITLTLKWLKDDGSKKPVSSWSFDKARIQGVDFGNASTQRTEPNFCTIEIAYDSINIDGVLF